jgi:hypothetical protein
MFVQNFPALFEKIQSLEEIKANSAVSLDKDDRAIDEPGNTTQLAGLRHQKDRDD